MAVITITADDYGFDPGIDSGIHRCLDAGGIDNISVWVDGDVSGGLTPQKGTKIMDNERPIQKAALGLHWNLLPLEIDVNRISDALSIWNHFWPSGAEVRRETARLDKSWENIKKSGLEVVFFNGHQHLHLLPGWIDPLAQWCRNHEIKIMRQPSELGKGAWDYRLGRPGLLILEFMGMLGSRLGRRKGIEFIPAVCRWGRSFRLEEVAKSLENLPEPHVEFMVHPGDPTPEFMGKVRWPLDQRSQMNELCRPDRDAVFQKSGLSRKSISEIFKTT